MAYRRCNENGSNCYKAYCLVDYTDKSPDEIELLESELVEKAGADTPGTRAYEFIQLINSYKD